MAINETAKATVYLDGKQAQTALGALAKEAEKFQKEMKQALAEGDMKKFKTAEKNLKSTQRAMGGLKKELFSVDKVMKNLSGATLNDLQKALRKTNTEMRRMRRTDPGWEEKRKQAQLLNQEVRRVRTEMGSMQTPAQRFMGTVKSWLPALSVTAVIGGLKAIGTELFALTKQMQGDAVRSSTVFGNELGYVKEQGDKVAAQMGLTTREYTALAAATADLLIPLGFQRDQSAKMAVDLQGLTGALDEWTAGQIGAKGVSDILTKAMLGENEGLKQLGIAIQMDSKEFKDLVKVHEKVTGTTNAQAKAMATLELITQKSADAQAAYTQEGNKLLRLQKSMSVWWKNLKEGVVEYLSASKAELLTDQRNKVNTLTVALYENNLESEERKRIVNELKTLAPDIVKTLDDEMKATDKTREALKKYNNEMIKKIFLATKQVEVDKINTEIADRATKVFEAEATARERINELIKDNTEGRGEEMRQIQESGKSISEQIKAIKELGVEVNKITSVSSGGVAGSAYANTEDYQGAINTQNMFLDNSKNELKGLLSEMDDMRKWFDDLYGTGGGENKETPDIVTPTPKKKTEDPYTKATKVLETAHKERANLIKSQYAEDQLNKQEYNASTLAQEMIYLEARKAINEQFGKSTLDLESQILDKKIQARIDFEAFQDELDLEGIENDDIEMKAIAASIEATADAEIIRMDNLRELHDQEMAMLQEKAAGYANFSGGVSQGLESMFTVMSKHYDSAEEKQEALEQAFTDSFKNILFIALDALKAQTELAVAGVTIQSLASPESVATFGAAGIAKAAIMVGLVEAAFAVVKGSIAGFGSKREGGYGELGPDDKVMGVYHGNEFIANAQAVRNPQVRQVLDIIDIAQRNGTISTIDLPKAITGQLPGKQAGGYGGDQATAPASLNIPAEFYQMMQETRDAINTMNNNGVKGVWEWEADQTGREKMNALESDVGLTNE